ncbi:MAG TPA: ATP-binding protein [Gaiellaceae bacterium]
MRPLDFLGSIKLKLGVVIVAAVAVTVAVVSVGEHFHVEAWITGVVAAGVALAMVQLLAHGMTYPLREMVAASRAMAKGDYHRRVTATSRDEVGELARAFNSMAEELAEVDRIRRDLVANASHELRTPLGALRATLENLVDGVEPVDRVTLETMLHQVERLGSLVEQLLDLSKLESGAVPLERERVPARVLLHEVEDEWRPQADAHRLRFSTSVLPDDLALHADAQRLRQVLSNLVANAMRHSPDGGRVIVRASAVNGHTRIEVIDDGPGIDPAERTRVFERFYRADAARSGGGSGLGLAIARWIVELHGGAIHAESSEPHGCRMVVEIPA